MPRLIFRDLIFRKVSRHAPLKGGSYSSMNTIFLKNENAPPFRGNGGRKQTETGDLLQGTILIIS